MKDISIIKLFFYFNVDLMTFRAVKIPKRVRNYSKHRYSQTSLIRTFLDAKKPVLIMIVLSIDKKELRKN